MLLDDQSEPARQAAERASLLGAGEYCDSAISGRTLMRTPPRITANKDRVTGGDICTVIIAAVHRIGRRAADIGATAEGFESCDVELHVIHDGKLDWSLVSSLSAVVEHHAVKPPARPGTPPDRHHEAWSRRCWRGLRLTQRVEPGAEPRDQPRLGAHRAPRLRRRPASDIWRDQGYRRLPSWELRGGFRAIYRRPGCSPARQDRTGPVETRHGRRPGRPAEFLAAGLVAFALSSPIFVSGLHRSGGAARRDVASCLFSAFLPSRARDRY